jgi:hypothetical protein
MTGNVNDGNEGKGEARAKHSTINNQHRASNVGELKGLNVKGLKGAGKKFKTSNIEQPTSNIQRGRRARSDWPYWDSMNGPRRLREMSCPLGEGIMTKKGRGI